MESRYQPIENYGVIGNLRTAALVGHGRLDRLALPAALRFAQRLRRHPRRPARAGRFRIAPVGRPTSGASSSTGRTPTSSSPASCTTTASARSRTTCRSAAPARAPDAARPPGPGRPRHDAVSPRVPARLRLRPRRPRDATSTSTAPASTAPGLSLGLASPVPLRRDGGGVVADFTLGEGENATFVLRRLAAEDEPEPLSRRRRGGGAVPRHRRLLAALALASAPTPAAGARWSTARP